MTTRSRYCYFLEVTCYVTLLHFGKCNLLQLQVSLTLSPPIPLRLYSLPYWSNPLCLIFSLERQSDRMSKIKHSGLDQYGAEPFEQQQFGTAGVEGVKA